MKISIDIVIPSFRLEEKYILPILNLKRPADAEIRIFLVADNPSAEITPALSSAIDSNIVFLIRNPANLGASQSRNNGIDAGNGKWILFLDDDIEVNDDLLEIYTTAILTHPHEIGFIGLIKLPQPLSAFNKAIVASGYMNIFSIALFRKSHAWGATANIMVRRSALGDTRFSLLYPKSGGGEDVDFFLKIREKNSFRNYLTLPEAVVYHPWWANTKTDFTRIFRYGKASSILERANPRYTYRDFLNTPESTLVIILLMIFIGLFNPSWIKPLLLLIPGIIIIEFIATAVQTWKRSPGLGLRTLLNVLFIKLAHETGVLWSRLVRLDIGMIGIRFHIDGRMDKRFFIRTNTYRIIKWVMYPLLIFTVFKYFS